MSATSVRHSSGAALGTTLALARRGLRRDKWLAGTWTVLLVSGVYASAMATPWLYPTVAQRVAVAAAIDASPGIVALYGPIVVGDSLGELAMVKMTVLYSVLVAFLCSTVVRRYARDRADSNGPASVLLIARMVEAAVLALAVGLLAAVANIIAGLPVVGSIAFGCSWAGLGLVAATLTAALCWLIPAPRSARIATLGALATLFALRAIGDSQSIPWLGWLSPFGWGTRLQPWSSPNWSVLGLYGATALTFGLFVYRSRNQDLPFQEVEVVPRGVHEGPTLVAWTVATGGLAAYFGVISDDISGLLLGSPNARAMIERLGGNGPLSDVVVAAEFSVIAALLTAFGVSVVNHAARTGQDRTASLATWTAFAGTAWLLFIIGFMFMAGRVAAGGTATSKFILAALNHAPAVWTIIAMTVVAWSLRTAWAGAGWGLLILFAAIGPFGRIFGLPHWLLSFSPFTRISLMPAAGFDWISTVALTVGAGVLLAIAAYNFSRRG